MALLSGHVLDRTTGQPLADVRVSVGAVTASSDREGRYALRVPRAGSYTLTLQSSDVPLERTRITLKAGRNQRDVRACSTTLDYGCGEVPGTSGAG